MASRTLDVISGRPTNGFSEFTLEEGTYRGEWQNGQPHGLGNFYYNTGVRYSGNWHDGKPFGKGEWTREKPPSPPPPKVKVAHCKCTVRQDRKEKEGNLIDPISYSVFLKHSWPPGAHVLSPSPFVCHRLFRHSEKPLIFALLLHQV